MAQTVQQTINRSDLNTLADTLRALNFGDVLRGLPTSLRKSGTAASTAVDAAALVVAKQAETAPAASVFSAYARAGAGTPGALAVVAGVPAAGQIAISPNGSLITALADAWTDVDVTYAVEKGDVVEFTGSVAANVLALPSSITDRGAVLLLSAVANTGTSTGAKEVLAPGAVPAAANANLNPAKSSVQFAVADAVTNATVRLLIGSAVDVSLALASDSTFV